MAFWIVTDACSDLPVDYIKKQHDLYIVPMSYQIDGNVQQIDLTDDFSDGFVNSLRVETPDKTRFAAARASRYNGEITTFDNGV